jgi:hypothetical protein
MFNIASYPGILETIRLVVAKPGVLEAINITRPDKNRRQAQTNTVKVRVTKTSQVTLKLIINKSRLYR